MAFTVDRESHTYRLDGTTLDSVTDILVGLGVIDTEYYTVTGRIRGSKVHLGCELLEKPDGLDWESLKPIEAALGEPITDFVQGYNRFLRETGWKSDIIEKPGYHATYLYAGTPDRIGRFPGDSLNSVLDIKTGQSVHPGTALQISAYDEMVPNGGPPRRRYGVLLKGKGDFILTRFDDHNDGQTFLSSLSLYRWKKKKGLIRNREK